MTVILVARIDHREANLTPLTDLVGIAPRPRLYRQAILTKRI